MLAEYNSLRTESLSGITNRVAIANFVFGALGVLIAALVAQGNPSVLTGLIAAIAVPQIAKVGLLIWLGEYGRSQRAGKWIAELEGRISRLLETDRVMAWESDLMSASTHMSYPYLSVVLMLLGVGWTGIAVGGSIFVRIFGWPRFDEVAGIASIAVVAALAIWELVFARLIFWRKWLDIRRNYSALGGKMWLGKWEE
jgi:hypothetical protein